MSDSTNLIGFDAVIYSSEINDRHGVGILLQRIFPSTSRIISIRTHNYYGGEHIFGQVAILVNHRGLTRALSLQRVAEAVGSYKIDRILCIPYDADEVLTALALHELFGAPICTYIMDDQNILVKNIPDNLMTELLRKSGLCLGISPELCDVYRTKFKIDIHFAPPVLPKELVKLSCNAVKQQSEVLLSANVLSDLDHEGVMIGNVWSPNWLKLLQATVREAGITLDWYGNTGAEWNIGDRQQLLADGIIEKGFLPTEAEVIVALSQYKYAIVPSGTLDLHDGNPATAWLSLPSRIPFMLSHIPIIIMGHRDTGAARFVKSMGIGIAADYEPHSLLAAIAKITQPDYQKYCRQKAASLAPLLINYRTDQWLWDSLAIGKPIDQRFQKILTSQVESNYLSAFTQALDTIGSQRAEITTLNHALTVAQQSYIKNQQMFEQQIQELQIEASKSIRSRLLDKIKGMKQKFKGKLKKHLKKLIRFTPKLTD